MQAKTESLRWLGEGKKLTIPFFQRNYVWEKKNWEELLQEYPQFSRKCDWSKLSSENWVELLKRQPKFADKCDWSQLDEYECFEIWHEHPDLKEYKR